MCMVSQPSAAAGAAPTQLYYFWLKVWLLHRREVQDAQSLLFHLVEACWTNCQTCQIKNKSIHPGWRSSQTSNKRRGDARFDVVHCSARWESMFPSREYGFFLTWSVRGRINAWNGNMEESQTWCSFSLLYRKNLCCRTKFLSRAQRSATLRHICRLLCKNKSCVKYL